MSFNREPIYLALFDRLRVIPGLVTVSRKLRHWTDVPAGEQPALFLAQRREAVNGTPGLPRIWQFQIDAYLYVNTNADPDAAPATQLNLFLDGIQAALAPDVSGKQTLGGLVEHCWIEGNVETDEGTLGDQAVAIVPVAIKVTGY